MSAAERYERLATCYKRVTWFGIVLNCLFIFPLLLVPRFTLDLLGIPLDQLIFARTAGMLLLWISIFYVPASTNLKKYRVYAWIAAFPTRFGGAAFFYVAVFVFGYPRGYVTIALVDSLIFVLWMIILLKVRAVERQMSSPLTGLAPRSGRWWKVLGALVLVVAVVGFAGWYKLLRVVPQRFDSMEEAFKYGSIGTEQAQGVPFWIWLVLPRIFPEYLPGPGGYSALGLHTEPGRELPVGFSLKTVGIPRVGITCALCHSNTIRLAPDETPILLLGGGSSTFDALRYQRFLFQCASDPRFNADTILAAVDAMYKLSFADRALYRYVLIPFTRKALLEQKAAFAWTETRPEWGRGRIDPFNPVKVSTLHVSVGDTIGNSDMMPIWNLRAREGTAYHWDGLNTALVEVVRSSAIGDGATPKSIPLADLDRLQAWLLDLKPPRYPSERFPVNQALAAAGRAVFSETCAKCHAHGGARNGQVIPLGEVGTDPHRARMWTEEAANAYNAYARDYPWGFSHFQSNNGYVSLPLDAIWTRAPYLHNGSVPSLRDMLQPPENRPKVFYRGYNVFDPQNVGYVSQGPEAQRVGTRYDVSQPGNSNEGHLFGTGLPAKDKDALIEFLKTL
jgi:hypothetical protein